MHFQHTNTHTPDFLYDIEIDDIALERNNCIQNVGILIWCKS